MSRRVTVEEIATEAAKSVALALCDGTDAEAGRVRPVVLDAIKRAIAIHGLATRQAIKSLADAHSGDTDEQTGCVGRSQAIACIGGKRRTEKRARSTTP